MISYGSTGNIMLHIAETVRDNGDKAKTFSTLPFDKNSKQVKTEFQDHCIFGTFKENRRHYYLGSMLGRNGCFSHHGTRNLIKQLREFQPDVLHLHNLHKFCVNLPMLFRYIKKDNVNVVWTLHDCWAFTGQCPYFTMIKCDKWETGCYQCPQIDIYPKSRIDNSKKMYELKRRWFTGVQNMTIVTPSQWLADLVKISFLKEYPVKVIPNGIDLSIFKPTPSNFKTRYGIGEEKYVVLAVSFGWGIRKGLDILIEISKRLDDRFQLVVVGTDCEAEKVLPKNIISIQRTQNQLELAEIYTAANLFVNPTREDNYPTVNMEALACGTPVLTFKTGGSPESVDETCGSVVECDDIDTLEREIRRICIEKPYSEEACLNRAKNFDMYKRFKEYVRLYEDCTHSAECTI